MVGIIYAFLVCAEGRATLGSDLSDDTGGRTEERGFLALPFSPAPPVPLKATNPGGVGAEPPLDPRKSRKDFFSACPTIAPEEHTVEQVYRGVAAWVRLALLASLISMRIGPSVSR